MKSFFHSSLLMKFFNNPNTHGSTKVQLAHKNDVLIFQAGKPFNNKAGWKKLFMFDLFNCYLIETPHSNSASIYLFKVNNGNTRAMYEVCSKLTIKSMTSF